MTAVVTGGGSGIGAACVAALHAAGAQVGILDLQPGDTTDPGLLPVPADVADDASVKTAVARVADQFGGLDILVNSAGVGAAGPLEGHDDAEWARVLDVNVTGIARACRAALPYLRRSRHGSIVNLSSIAAWAGLPNRSLYSASKGAVHALTFALAADLVADQIRVNCVCPGTVDTPWVTRLLAAAEDPAAERARLASRQPSGRLVSAAEVAAAVCYLAGPAAGSTTGTALAVDGGMHGLRLPPPG
ncbi:SDR family oxidoreductase [Natronosporangium hydrolyticum]|uniref:SDR family oxidoreductase n=2 Tax=Natronosporangium hydrolyticum TaxID=2811111 RepID=A0A895YHP7_9ACTN|nr:SDR family oxidoreductase [Natronosporangium hydrolyticum]